MRFLLRGVYSPLRTSADSGAFGLRRRDFADAEFVAGFVGGAQKRGPIFEIGGEDFFHHAAGEFGDELVQRDGRQAFFVGEARPVKIVGVPRFGEEAARVTHECGEGWTMEKAGAVGWLESGRGAA